MHTKLNKGIKYITNILPEYSNNNHIQPIEALPKCGVERISEILSNNQKVQQQQARVNYNLIWNKYTISTATTTANNN